MQHTKTPWAVAERSSNAGNGSAWRDILSTGAEFSPCYVGEALKSDAAHIVRCVNNFDALLAALNRIAIMPDNMIETARTVARAALAAAKGE